ncbi:CCA tRNA nucleotidyltransferase [Francisella philomiragia]|uniref:tRNA nucleotidyl transferase n=1 Tax=Francisella philomiragia subsp. philomiragia (strain ATCC 25017 / CCUG 19701 / FSC 153 / O\|nr:CCA tRNA nucleotidyltransferase [Francisella philomiragia]AJI48141.1 poly A polymerase head domain protein [Francisella philomiragia]AJI50017.1 poly A polymerase head domain protein [Francisella philomiragia]MBK2020379.1 CCA tRNA nucleotidyltransferase [Francisella philomiragia]MBK2030079.1 CCA tRNA nucleotidyltransferase [Francisella philomiragia]MBK2263076.1 CCA tRNA nucleotidyltransferase [Francisella philomiragia]
MEFYLVGGAVRDILLGIAPKDRDWVVVGATETQMIKAGFTKILSSFPVFLHPETKEEYALARSEKKIAKGYHGFEVNFSSNITLEEDLKRRDLTINSMAIDKNNNIIDPFNGQNDIKNRILRHTSEAFIEDPLRVVRLARFKVQLSAFNFSIADETINIIKSIIKSGELNYLTKERLHIEFIKALRNPKIFFETLDEFDSLRIIFPSIKKSLNAIPNNNFFRNKTYLNSSNEEKICLCLLNLGDDTINNLKLELLLTNKQLKLLIATSAIKKIIEFKSINAETALKIIKRANLLRDKKLQQNAIDIFEKYSEIDNSRFSHTIIKQFKSALNIINTTNIETLITTVPKENLANAIKTLYMDIIKKQLNL